MNRDVAIAALAALLLALGFSSVEARTVEEHPKSSFRLPSRGMLTAATGAQITVNTTEFTAQRQAVQVTWSGVSSPAPDDMIALYVPADADVTATVPVEFLSCALVAPDYNKTGSGSHVFNLINMRQSFRFALIKGALTKPTVVAQSQRIDNLIPHQPTGLHLALHADQRSVVVQWVTGTARPQQVRFRPLGAPPSADQLVQASSALKYAARQMCAFPANSTGWLDPGFTQSAVLPASALRPGQRYVYRVGGEEVGWSTEHSFLAPVGAGWDASSPEPFVFLNFNDVAMSNPVMKASAAGVNFIDTYGENSTLLSSWLGRGAEAGAHLALVAGDLSYAQGYGADWDYFNAQFADVFTQWPVATTNGNHERDQAMTGDAFNNTASDSGGECGVAYMYRWYTPANAHLDPDVAYYAFAQGPVHFVMIDTEMPTAPGTPQHTFVAEALASVDRSVTPWLVVAMHRMMAAPSTWSAPYQGDLEVMARLQSDFEQLFFDHQVDVVLQGHEHAYARSCPMFPAGTCAAAQDNNGTTGGDATSPYGGPVYILAGHAGARATNVFPHPLPSWVAFGVEAVPGYVRGSATLTTLRLESIRSADGGLMDAVELRRPPAVPLMAVDPLDAWAPVGLEKGGAPEGRRRLAGASSRRARPRRRHVSRRSLAL